MVEDLELFLHKNNNLVVPLYIAQQITPRYILASISSEMENYNFLDL